MKSITNIIFKRHFVLLLLCIIAFVYTSSQQPATKITSNTLINDIDTENLDDENENENESDTVVVVPDDFDSSLDFLLYSWAVDRNTPSECLQQLNPIVIDDEYKNRLKKLPHIIEMPFNSAVKSFIEVYTQKRRKEVEYMLGLSNYYFPIFEEALNAANLPLELKYLPIIESALNPTAISRAGAGGLWQFMISTGRMYNLEINSLVDDRFDPIKSTNAAVKYLKDLYSIYGDWNLAIAAYNCGPGNVNKAIRRSGGKRDFWEIYSYLPRETRGYVPIFIAANYTIRYHKEHNLCPTKVRLSSFTDTVTVNNRIYFDQIVSVLNIPIEELRLLNPQYKKDIVPGDIKPYSICLPINYASQFIDKMNEVFAYKSDVFANLRRDETTIPEQSRAVSSKKTTYHTVKRGQTLSGIAKKYGVSVSQLKSWNRMGKKTKILKGQRLVVGK